MEAQASTSATSSATSSVDGRRGGGNDYVGMFSASGVSDLLQGFGGSLGNGFGNIADASGGGAGQTGSSAFDLSDFPSLGGGNNANGVPGAIGGGNSGNGLAAALRQQQQLLQHQQMLQVNSNNGNNIINNNNAAGQIGAGQIGGNNKSSNLYRLAMQSGASPGANFNMATEDFPALPGAPAGGGASIGAGQNASSLLLGGNNNSRNISVGGGGPFGGSGSVSRASSGGSVGGLYGGNEMENNGQQEVGGLLGGAGIGGLGVLGGLQQSSNNPGSSLLANRAPSSSAPGSSIGSSNPAAVGSGSSSSAAGTALSGDYGLLGLLGVIRMTDADRNSLALGSDLTLLGLSLGSSDQIYQTFSSPWTESVSSKEPHYQLPMCYYMQPPALKTGHLSKFQLETLFYIFYALPKDVLQAYAAQELYTREWRYHADNKLWFKRAGPADGVPASSSGAPQYLYFDINSWERRLFNGSMNQNFTSSFLPEEDVRVKFSNP